MDDIIAYEQNNAAEVLTIHDALSYCIDRIGRVDLSTIAALAKSTREEVLASLSGTIYFDPERGEFVAADEYHDQAESGPTRYR